jgi:thiol-disulfide isomerase/thioredoxin
LPLAEEFVKKAPKDDRAALLLNYVAGKMTDDTKRAALEKRIEKDFPDSPLVQQKIRLKAAEIRLKDAVGQPFKIEFTDAIKGGHVTMASLKGKVVIIDFWATWCPPCVADMPNMKKLYAEYRTKGVEFIGVSLDQPKDNGGYDLLKAFVEKNKIDWPQFYDPEGKHEFALDWGVNSIPTIFAVDADGNLASLDAAGQLETLIPNLLKKAEKSKKTQARP